MRNPRNPANHFLRGADAIGTPDLLRRAPNPNRRKAVAKKAQAKRLPRSITLASKLITTDTALQFTEKLQRQYRLHFLIRWTRRKPLVLQSLQVKAAPDNLWKELLERPLGDYDGELVLDMGRYSAGEIRVRFRIGALTKVPRAVSYLVEDETRVVAFKPADGSDPKSVEQGVPWEEVGTYQVGATI
jgi:hypothetical protein